MDNPSLDRDAANFGIRDAIAGLCADPATSNRRILYERLLLGNLILAVAEHPVPGIIGTVQLTKDTDVQILTTSAPDGGWALLAFTDVSAARERSAIARLIVMGSREVLRLTLDWRLSGLLLNPSGPWAYVSSQEIMALLREDSGVRCRGPAIPDNRGDGGAHPTKE